MGIRAWAAWVDCFSLSRLPYTHLSIVSSLGTLLLKPSSTADQLIKSALFTLSVPDVLFAFEDLSLAGFLAKISGQRNQSHFLRDYLPRLPERALMWKKAGAHHSTS
jgi:hypothetical protein